jgi:succinoglycan biosynthesis transport protein ExoP
MSSSLLPPTPVAGGGEFFTALQIWQVLRKHWGLMLAAMAAAAIATTFYLMGRTTIYRSSATVLIDPMPPSPLGKGMHQAGDPWGWYWSEQVYLQTQSKVLTSRHVASLTVKRLGLQNDPAFAGTSSQRQKSPAAEMSIDTAASILEGMVDVKLMKDTRLLSVGLQDSDPYRAQRLLAGVIETFSQQNLDEAANASTSSNEWLRNQVTSLKQELESNEQALHAFKKDRNILSVSFTDQTNMLREELTRLTQSLTEARDRREKAAARRAELMKLDVDDLEALPTGELLASSPILAQLRNDFVSARRDRDSLRASGRGTNHPDVLAAESRVKSSRRALLAEVRSLQAGAKRDLDVVTRHINGLTGLYEAAKHQALDLNQLEIDYKRLERVKENSERLYSLVLERSKEGDLVGQIHVNNIRVVDAPLPGVRVKPNVPVTITAGLLLGFALGLVAAFGRNLLDRTLKTREDLEQELRLPFLGLLPRASQRGAGRGRSVSEPEIPSCIEHMVHLAPASPVAEAARIVRTNILFMAPDRPHRCLLVTSPDSDEGKTTLASWLATVMSQSGHRVLLVDCDLRRPRIHESFGRANQPGLSEMVLDRDLLDRVDLATHVPNLSVLPAGSAVPSPADLLGSHGFAELLGELGRRYDRVILDSPPVTPITDASILATQVDGTVLVTRAGHTPKDAARRAAEQIRAVGGRLVGVVLNCADGNRSRYYYKYDARGSQATSKPMPPVRPQNS